MKKLNKVPYDKNYNDTQYHGCEVNKKFGYICPYQNGNSCQLRVMLKQNPKVFLGTDYRLMPGVCMRKIERVRSTLSIIFIAEGKASTTSRLSAPPFSISRIRSASFDLPGISSGYSPNSSNVPSTGVVPFSLPFHLPFF